MIIALSLLPCLRLNTDSVFAPLRPVFRPLRNVNSLLPSLVFPHFGAQPLDHDTMRKAKHQARAPGSNPETRSSHGTPFKMEIHCYLRQIPGIFLAVAGLSYGF
jgi:hypothetical protein